MKQKLLVFDTQWMAFRNFYSMPPLSSGEFETHIIFSFVQDIINHCHRYGTNKICFPFDSKYSLRKDDYPQYKEKRNKKKQERTEEEKILFKSMYQQMDLMKNEVLSSLGFNNIWYQHGLESDDTIANFVMRYSDRYDIIVFTKDNDSFQLLDHCTITNPIKKNGLNIWKEYSKMDFIKEYGIQPKEWIECKKVAGCTSDNVIGIERVGIPTFLKYYKGEMNPKTKTYEKIEELKDHFAGINEPLVKLPHEKTLDVDYVEDSFNKGSFIDLCQKFQFDSFIKGSALDKWEETFCGDNN